MIGLLVWFLYKVIAIYSSPSNFANLLPSRGAITIFGISTIVLTVITIINSIACMLNFGKGLRQYIARGQSVQQPKDEWATLTSRLGGRMIRERISFERE